jgi:hypothetical protein
VLADRRECQSVRERSDAVATDEVREENGGIRGGERSSRGRGTTGYENVSRPAAPWQLYSLGFALNDDLTLIVISSPELLTGFLFKQVMQITAFLMRPQEGYGDSAAADLAVIRHSVPHPSRCSGPA